MQLIRSLLKAPKLAGFYGNMHEIFLLSIYKELYEVIKPGTTLLDLGGFIGDSVAYFAMNLNVEKVIAVEANPEAYDYMVKNLAHFQYNKKISFLNVAMSSSSGFATSNKGIKSGNSIKINKDEGVPTKSLANLLENLTAPIAIKCDIEGSEKDLFKTDLSKVYAIELEYHNNLGQEIEEDLKERGFEIKETTSFSRRGMIFAIKPSKQAKPKK